MGFGLWGCGPRLDTHRVSSPCVRPCVVVCACRRGVPRFHVVGMMSNLGGLRDAAQKMWKREGPGVFFRGLWAKMFQTVLNAASTLMVYEVLLKLTRLTPRLIRHILAPLFRAPTVAQAIAENVGDDADVPPPL